MPLTRTGEIVEAIRGRIASRAFGPSDRLPSIRGLAASMGVSPSTVVEAYDRLAAEGLIRSRPGSGFFVAGPVPPLALAELGPKLDREIDPFWVSRQSLDASAAMLKPGCGWLPPDWMPDQALRKALRALSRADGALLCEYGSTRGTAGLRRLIARQLSDEGLSVDPDHVLLTSSGTQAIDLICRFLLRPGDAVLLDDPCYFNFQALMKAHQADVVSVPYTASGPDVARLAEILAERRPRLYVTNSAIHNPTGATISPMTAHRVLSLAAAHDMIVVEDDIFAPFEEDTSPRLAALDGLERVIRIGSFSKTLSASIRCGYIAAKPDWIEALTDLQLATNFGGPSPLAAELVLHTLGDGSFRRHMEGVRRRLSRARRDVVRRLEPLGIEPWLMPRGGFYLWCTLPESADAQRVAQAALRENVVLAPGNAFSPVLSKPGFMRFNVSQMTDPRTLDVLARSLRARAAEAASSALPAAAG